jgi:hypothetical protein
MMCEKLNELIKNENPDISVSSEYVADSVSRQNPFY